MKVYELIQKLAKYPANAEVEFEIEVSVGDASDAFGKQLADETYTFDSLFTMSGQITSVTGEYPKISGEVIGND